MVRQERKACLICTDRKRDLHIEMMNSQLIKGLFIDWNRIDEGSYLRRIEALEGLDSLSFDHSVTFFVGENGSGKSTLLEAIAVAYGFNPEGGTVNFNFATNDSHSDLHRYMTVSRGYKRHRDSFFVESLLGEG